MAMSILASVLSCIVLVHSVVTVPVQRLCDADQYLDHSVGRCVQCVSVCKDFDDSYKQLCKTFCPEFYNQLKRQRGEKESICPPGTYEDKVTVRCRPCSALCEEQSNAFQTREVCERFCPAYERKDENKESTPGNYLLPVLWSVAAILLVCLISMVTFICVKFTRLCRDRQGEIRIKPSQLIPYVKKPYGKLPQPDSKQLVDQWLTFLQTPDGETESCHSNRNSLTPPAVGADTCDSNRQSLIYNPVKQEKC